MEPLTHSPCDYREVQFHEAVRQMFHFQRSSADFFRRKMFIGYNKASSYVVQLEQMGFLGPLTTDGSARKITKTWAEWLAWLTDHDVPFNPNHETYRDPWPEDAILAAPSLPAPDHTEAISIATKAIAQRLSICLQRGGDVPAMSMAKLSEIVADGLGSCWASIASLPATGVTKELLELGRQACQALANSQQARSRGDDRYEQQAEKWTEVAGQFSAVLAGQVPPKSTALSDGEGWVKCSDQYPVCGETYLTISSGDSSSMAVRFLSDDNVNGELMWTEMPWDSEEGPDITHWKPLPKAPLPASPSVEGEK